MEKSPATNIKFRKQERERSRRATPQKKWRRSFWSQNLANRPAIGIFFPRKRIPRKKQTVSIGHLPGKSADSEPVERIAFGYRLGADRGTGGAGGRASLRRGQAAIPAIARRVHGARIANERIFLLVRGWIIAGGSAHGISGCVLFNCKQVRS